MKTKGRDFEKVQKLRYFARASDSAIVAARRGGPLQQARGEDFLFHFLQAFSEQAVAGVGREHLGEQIHAAAELEDG